MVMRGPGERATTLPGSGRSAALWEAQDAVPAGAGGRVLCLGEAGREAGYYEHAAADAKGARGKNRREVTVGHGHP
jgi:hypothetical protein